MGNKCDDPNHKVVLTEDAQRFANQMNIQLFETSAKDDINVEPMFMAITKMVLRTKKEQQQQQKAGQDDRIKIGESRRGSSKGGKKCC